ncbi:MAG: helix-turn-helix transcriptional regulator [Clostridia bacterium]|nr:helix-turn-helix transcriptional regulator [Clostridia bacterium]
MEITIGTNIKRLRNARNITQEQLAEAMNVTCAAVSKWERGETYPDITLLGPLAYYFEVTLDELMGYNREKVQTEINKVIALYRQYWKSDYKKAREIIIKAHHDYPDDYFIMHYYMWNLGGDMADNDPEVLIAHKDEFLAICDKIIEGCTEENLRLNAWNMRAKILHAEGKTEEALEIYQNKFTDWYTTAGQKSEQLFAKNTDEYYYWVRKNMYELVEFAADKLGRVVFFDGSLSMSEKAEKALRYGDIMLNTASETGDSFFILLACTFLGRMENDLYYRGGSDSEVISVMDKHLYAAKLFSERMSKDEVLHCAYMARRSDSIKTTFLEWLIGYHRNAKSGRRAELLKNPEYVKILDKYN